MTDARGARKIARMKITIESTDKVVTLVLGNARIPARIWEGFTADGVPVHCFIPRIAPTVRDAPENKTIFEQFERELLEQRKPSVEADAIPLRLIL